MNFRHDGQEYNDRDYGFPDFRLPLLFLLMSTTSVSLNGRIIFVVVYCTGKSFIFSAQIFVVGTEDIFMVISIQIKSNSLSSH